MDLMLIVGNGAEKEELNIPLTQSMANSNSKFPREISNEMPGSIHSKFNDVN